MRDPREDNLLERLKAGDDRALADVAETYGSKIYQLAFRYLRNKEDAEEVTQDVLFKVHRKVGAFRGDAALSSWIYRITFNAAMSRLRTAKYQRSQDEGAQQAGADADAGREPSHRSDVADWSDLADERLLRSQLRSRVFRAILAMPAAPSRTGSAPVRVCTPADVSGATKTLTIRRVRPAAASIAMAAADASA